MTKTSIELKNMRLEREQADLVDVIANMITDIQTLIRYADVERIPRAECIGILAHHKHAIQIMADILDGR